MVLLRDIARITVTSGELNTDEVASAAWILWKSTRREIEKKGLPSFVSREGVAGNRLDGSLIKHIISLWPEYLGWGQEEQVRFRGALYSYLKSTNNAHCLVPTRSPVWWISTEFNKVATQKIFGGAAPQPLKPTRTEQRLTPHEVGEDRPPAPVVVTHNGRMPEPMTAMEAPIPPLELARESRRMLREKRRATLISIVSNLQEPATAGEIAHQMQKDGSFSGDVSTTRTDLSFLSDQGVVASRQETREERTIRGGGQMKATRARLYWPSEPVPPRTQRTVVNGFTVQPAPIVPIDSSAGLKIAIAVAKYVRHGSFSVADIASSSGVNEATVRHHINVFETDKLIVATKAPTGSSQLRHYYRVPKDKEETVRQLGKKASTKLNRREKRSPATPPATVTKLSSDPDLRTTAEQNAWKILGILADLGKSVREYVLMQDSGIKDRNEFNEAISLLITGKMVSRVDVSGVVFYGTEAPVVSDPPPSVATAAITALEAQVDDEPSVKEESPLEKAFDIIRTAFVDNQAADDDRVFELERTVTELQGKLDESLKKLAKAQAAVRILAGE